METLCSLCSVSEYTLLVHLAVHRLIGHNTWIISSGGEGCFYLFVRGQTSGARDNVYLYASFPFCLSVCLSVSLSLRICICMSVYLFVCLSVYMYLFRCLHVSFCRPVFVLLAVSMSVSLSASVYVCLFIYLSVCHSVCLFVCLPVC